jgi:hypothetical protein
MRVPCAKVNPLGQLGRLSHGTMSPGKWRTIDWAEREPEVFAMLRSAILASVCVTLVGCTTIKINQDDTSTVEYEGDAEVAKDLTTRACRRAGQQSAEIISTVNKDPGLPAGTGKQVTTFRCLSDVQQ